MAAAIEVLRQQGAIIVDTANIPSVLDQDPERSLLTSPPSSVLPFGMKRDFNTWLATLGDAAPVRTLTQLREWNLANESRGAIRYGQARLDGADELDLQESLDAYQTDRARDLFLSAEHGIDEVMAELNLDALLFPASSGAGIAARAGYPTVIVPFSSVENEPNQPLPAGFDAARRPFGVSFSAMACSEARLIELAYSFEQATRSRIAPPDLP
jgi:amidase